MARKSGAVWIAGVLLAAGLCGPAAAQVSKAGGIRASAGSGLAGASLVQAKAGPGSPASSLSVPLRLAAGTLFQPLTPRPGVRAPATQSVVTGLAPEDALSALPETLPPAPVRSSRAPVTASRIGSAKAQQTLHLQEVNDRTAAIHSALRDSSGGDRATAHASAIGASIFDWSQAKADDSAVAHAEEKFLLAAGPGRGGLPQGKSYVKTAKAHGNTLFGAAPEAGGNGSGSSVAADAAEDLERTLRLDNGMQVVLVREPGLFSANITVGYEVGGRDEAAGESGYTHFVEHLMFQGTKRIRNWFRVIGAMGAQTNAFTERDQTRYTQRVPMNLLEMAISLEAERMVNLDVTAAKVEREKRTILEEKAGMDNSPYASGLANLTSLIFSNFRNRSNVIGSEQDIRAATPKKLQRYLDAYYTPDRAKVVISGNIDLARTEEWVQEYLGSIPARHSFAPNPDLSEKSQDHERYSEVNDPFASAPAVLFGWIGPKYGTPAYYASGILSLMVQERLQRKLVLEGKRALGVSISLPYLERDPAAITGSIVLGSRLSSDEALSAIEAEISAIESGKFEPSELANAVNRQFMWAENQLLQSDHAMLLALAAVRGLSAADLRRDIARWQGVTPEEVRQAAQLLAKDKRSTVLVRPSAQAAKTTRSQRAHGHSPAVDEAPTREEERLLDYLADLQWPELNYKSPAEFTLANGLKVIVMPDRRSPTFVAKLAFRLGSTASDAQARNRASWVAGLLRRRTRLKSEAGIDDMLQQMGGAIGVDELDDHIVFDGMVHESQGRALLDLMAEMVVYPHAWTAGELAPLKAWWKESLKQSLSDPAVISQQRAVKDLIGVHPSAHSQSPEAIDAITPEESARLVGTHFTPDNAVLLVAGNVDPERLREVVEPLFQQWQPGGRSFAPGPEAAVRPQKAISLIDRPNSEQAMIKLSGIGIDSGRPSSPDFYQLEVADKILGDGFGSRLFQVVRQSLGYAYNAFSQFVADPALAMWTFGVLTRPEKTGPALQALLDQAERMRTETPSKLELASAKNGLIGAFLMSLDSIGNIANHLLGLELFGQSLNTWGLYPAKVAEVTGEGVRQIARKILDPRHTAITVVGDADAVRQGLSKLRPVEEYDQNDQPKPTTASKRSWLAMLRR